MRLVVAAIVIFFSLSSWANTVCQNEGCFDDAERMAAALAVIGAAVLPYYLAPKKSRRSGGIYMGGFVDHTMYARVEGNVTEIPNSIFGYRVAAGGTTFKDEKATNIRYELLGTYSLFKYTFDELNLGIGLAAEKGVETQRTRLGPPVALTYRHTLNDRWATKVSAGAYFLNKPVYRSRFELVSRAANHSNSDFTSLLSFGYEYEDHSAVRVRSHYLYFGLIF